MRVVRGPIPVNPMPRELRPLDDAAPRWAPFDVFISHRGEESFAVRVKDALRARGLEVWIDEDRGLQDARWKQRIIEGLSWSRSVALCLSDDPRPWERPWINAELTAAADRLLLVTDRAVGSLELSEQVAGAPRLVIGEDSSEASFDELAGWLRARNRPLEVSAVFTPRGIEEGQPRVPERPEDLEGYLELALEELQDNPRSTFDGRVYLYLGERDAPSLREDTPGTSARRQRILLLLELLIGHDDSLLDDRGGFWNALCELVRGRVPGAEGKLYELMRWERSDVLLRYAAEQLAGLDGGPAEPVPVWVAERTARLAGAWMEPNALAFLVERMGPNREAVTSMLAAERDGWRAFEVERNAEVALDQAPHRLAVILDKDVPNTIDVELLFRGAVADAGLKDAVVAEELEPRAVNALLDLYAQLAAECLRRGSCEHVWKNEFTDLIVFNPLALLRHCPAFEERVEAMRGTVRQALLITQEGAAPELTEARRRYVDRYLSNELPQVRRFGDRGAIGLDLPFDPLGFSPLFR